MSQGVWRYTHRLRIACAVWFAACDASGSDAITPDTSGDSLGEVAEAVLAPVDVAFLLPLDTLREAGLRAADVAAHGTILPRDVFDRVPALTRVDEPDALYAALTVVAVRLDPCFREGGATALCEAQVRLVLQPVIDSEAGPVTRDATIHAFHTVPSEALLRLVSDLANLRRAHGGDGAIGARPDAVAAADLLRGHIGARRLSRVTFMAVHASDEAWTFGSLVRDPATGDLRPSGIPGVPARAEQHLTSTGHRETLDATILPAPVLEPALAPLLSARERASLDASGQAEARAALARILDPAEHDTATLDCASCHVATGAAAFLAREPGVPPEGVYSDTRNQRMFGYFGALPSISPRVVAEVAATLAFIATPQTGR